MSYRISCFFLLAGICAVCSLQAQTPQGYFNGQSLITGNIYPETGNNGISLENELIIVKQLDTTALYDIYYDFKNTTNQYGNVSIVLPITIYFNEFAPGKRAKMLDVMAGMPSMSELFRIDDPSKDSRDQIYNKFGGRRFVRRYINADILRQLGIEAYLYRSGTAISFKKVMVEYRWEDPDKYNTDKNSNGNNSEVLVMDIRMSTDFQFTPNEQYNMSCYMQIQPLICGINEKQIYTPYQIGFDNNWAGSIKHLYLQHNIFDVTPVLPKLMTYESKYVNQRDVLTIIPNITPAAGDKIGFYDIRDNYSACGKSKVLPERLSIPAPVTNITASSWVKTDKKLAGRNYEPAQEIGLSSNIQAYQTGNPTNLDMFALNFETKPYETAGLNNLISEECRGDSSYIILKEYGNPLFAFDLSNYDSDDPNQKKRGDLQMQTCWCEGVTGGGKGEYIEFELTQPVNAIHIYNGNQLNKKVYDESTKADLIRFSALDNSIIYNGKPEAVFSIIDIPIENLYTLKLKPGKYRIYLDAIDEGKNAVTCLSSISFDFAVQDDWYNNAYSTVEAIYRKKK